jgi:dTMP kinase
VPRVKRSAKTAPAPTEARVARRAEKKYMGIGLPYIELDDLSGRLVVIEGSDGVGRSTQIALLRDWLQVQGFGVVETGWARSDLVGDTIDLAKQGHVMNPLTLSLLYASDFADRLEHIIIPALRAGFVVLADRYIYTAFARDAVRGVDTAWVRSTYGFAVEPDLVIYLKVNVETLFQRVMMSAGLDYWEAGMDRNPDLDPYESFRRYQSRLLEEFERLAQEFHFRVADAVQPVQAVQKELRRHISDLLGIRDGLPAVEPTAT